MTDDHVPIYYIWYGDWTNDTAPAILEPLAQNLGSSPWWAISSTYFDSHGKYVPMNALTFGGSYYDAYSQGATLDDGRVDAVLKNAIRSKNVPADDRALYVIMTSKDVMETSGFCQYYCSYHSYTEYERLVLKLVFVPNPIEKCRAQCVKFRRVSVNNHPAADTMASSIAHEIAEAVSDPLVNAWVNEGVVENGDLCAWKFGRVRKAANGGLYNMILGGFKFLIQENWVNAKGGYCALEYP